MERERTLMHISPKRYSLQRKNRPCGRLSEVVFYFYATICSKYSIPTNLVKLESGRGFLLSKIPFLKTSWFGQSSIKLLSAKSKGSLRPICESVENRLATPTTPSDMCRKELKNFLAGFIATFIGFLCWSQREKWLLLPKNWKCR